MAETKSACGDDEVKNPLARLLFRFLHFFVSADIYASFHTKEAVMNTWDKLSGEKLAELYVSATVQCAMLHWQDAEGRVKGFEELSDPEQKKCIQERYLQLIADETGVKITRWVLRSRTSKSKRESFYSLFSGCTHCGSETIGSRMKKTVNCLDCDGKGFWRSGTLGLTKNECSRCDGTGQMQEVHSICSRCRQESTEYWSARRIKGIPIKDLLGR